MNMGENYYRAMEEAYSKRINELIQINQEAVVEMDRLLKGFRIALEALQYSCEHGSLKCDKSCEYEFRQDALRRIQELSK